jgi:hypothetical protein
LRKFVHHLQKNRFLPTGVCLIINLRHLKNCLSPSRWQSHPFGKKREDSVLEPICDLASARGALAGLFRSARFSVDIEKKSMYIKTMAHVS